MARSLLERALLGEATLEVPDGEMEALRRVIAGAIKRRALPLNAKDWMRPAPQNRRASDRPAPPPAPAPAPKQEPTGGGVTSRRTGRTVPATNTFVQQARQGAQQAPAHEPDDDDDDRKWRGRRGDEEDFPSFPEPARASVHAGPPADDRVLSWDFLGRPDDGGIEVPEPGPGGGRRVQTLRGTDAPKSKGGSIARLFRKRPRDGRRELDKALRAADRPQGMLGRLIRGKDVTR